jgi:hypothetical protein
LKSSPLAPSHTRVAAHHILALARRDRIPHCHGVPV